MIKILEKIPHRFLRGIFKIHMSYSDVHHKSSTNLCGVINPVKYK